MMKTLILALAATFAFAQIPVKKTMNLALAKELAAAAEAEARKNNWNVVITIVDDSGSLVFLEKMDDTQYGSIDVSQKKARTAAKFRRSTRVFFDRLKSGDPAPLSAPDVIAIPGGLALMHEGKFIGGIGVSGVTQDQDEQIAQAAVAVLAKK